MGQLAVCPYLTWPYVWSITPNSTWSKHEESHLCYLLHDNIGNGARIFSSHISRTFKTLLLIVGEWPESFFPLRNDGLRQGIQLCLEAFDGWPAAALVAGYSGRRNLSSRPAIILTSSAVGSLLTPLMLFWPAVWEKKFRSEKSCDITTFYGGQYVLVVKKNQQKTAVLRWRN
jgi:hypothetical protein